MFPQNKGYLLYLPVFSTFKQEKCYKSKSIYIKFDSLSIFHVFCSKYLVWVIGFQENQLIMLIYLIKPFTIMPLFQSRQDI